MAEDHARRGSSGAGRRTAGTGIPRRRTSFVWATRSGCTTTAGLDGRIRIGFAEASVDDPLTWTKHAGNPVLDLAGPGEPDSEWCAYPWVVPVTETRWHMYYAGFGGEFWRPGAKIWYTMLAVSDDAGITWRRSGLGPDHRRW